MGVQSGLPDAQRVENPVIPNKNLIWEPSVTPTEPFLTVPEISKLLRIDRHTVCRIFVDEPGVVVIGNRETRRGQRKYRMLRIPTAVLNRVVARMTVR
jgi:hypothetical protein